MRSRSSLAFVRRVRERARREVCELVGLRSLRELGPPYELRATSPTSYELRAGPIFAGVGGTDSGACPARQDRKRGLRAN